MDKITIKDIADMCGVSKSSVSRYLNGGYVSQENKNKIKEAIEKTGFKTNFFAKKLKSKTSNLIGVVIPRLDSVTVGKVLNGINNICEKNSLTILIQSSNLKIEKEIENIKYLHTQGVDAIIVYSIKITDEHIAIANSLSIPILFLNQKNENVNYITIDDYKAGYLMGEYFFNKNHKDIVFLGVTENDNAVGVERKKGFYDFYKQNSSKHSIKFIETDFSFKTAYNMGKFVVSTGASAAVCATDNICLGLIHFLNEKNINVPNDISVAGFGGYEISLAMKPAITTIQFDYHLLGEKAVENVINLMNKSKNLPNLDIPIKFIAGESVKKI